MDEGRGEQPGPALGWALAAGVAAPVADTQGLVTALVPHGFPPPAMVPVVGMSGRARQPGDVRRAPPAAGSEGVRGHAPAAVGSLRADVTPGGSSQMFFS